jgi:hypothetical protein
MDCHESRRILPRYLSSDWSAGPPKLQAALNMTIAFALLIASAALGLAIGLVYRVWILGLVSPLIAIGSAITLHGHGFGFAGGVSVTIGCLVISQIAYLVGASMTSGRYVAENLTQEEIDGDPGSRGEQSVRDEDKYDK